MDGLLIDSEDHYTAVTNQILHENGRPDLPWNIKAQLQGRPGPAAGKIFRAWAQLPISEQQFMERQKELQAELFKLCKPLPGVEVLLQRLNGARTRQPTYDRTPGGSEKKVRMALATSSHRGNYGYKTQNLGPLFTVFPDRQKILGDDERIPKERGKPLPDIYLLALQTINEQVMTEGEGERDVRPDECLVFEDSVPGVEAGRRAGMRVVWVPHPGLLEVYKDQVADVLAGNTGSHNDGELDHTAGLPLKGSPGNVGEAGDGWGEKLGSLIDFDYKKYGIDISDSRYRSESGHSAFAGVTDRELEEMTAMADGKMHSPLGPTPVASPEPGAKESKF